MPSSWSATAEMSPVLVPPVCVNATAVSPGTRFPPASRATKVSVTVSPAATVAADTNTSDIAVEAVPGIPVAVKTISGSIAALAVNAFSPCMSERVQFVLAVPSTPVVTVGGSTPPPSGDIEMENVTLTPSSGVPSRSATSTDGVTTLPIGTATCCGDCAVIDAGSTAKMPNMLK